MDIRPFKPKFEMKPSKFGNLRLIPLGGVGDVTKNMYVYEYGQDIIIVDCGIGFPDEDMPGIDLVIPDVTYLKDKKHMIRGIIVTHPHDDHIGGLPYIWPELRCPIFAQRLAAGFIKNKFNEAKLPKDSIKNVDLSTQLKLGAFSVSFYGVSHSVPDATGLVIETPVGRIIHQADFKVDWTP
ncbi:MAG: Ribocuclease J, partial [Candidatus Daviesbacteria bacterium GW2011_GWA2_42_7]